MRTPYSLLCQLLDFFLKRKKLCIFLVVVFFVIVGISALCRGGFGPPPRRTDLTVFLRAAESIQSGENMYAIPNARGWYYVYLPLLAILLMPFTKLPLLLNSFMWYMLSVASLCGAVVLAARLAKDPKEGMRAATLAALFCVPACLETMARGQLGVMSVFQAIAILYLYTKNKKVWAGLLFAFSVALKASPLAPLVIFFLVKKEWKMCIVILLGLFFFGWIVPSLVLGVDQNWFYITEWNRIMSQAVSDVGHQSHIWKQLVTPFAPDNQSMYAAVTRWVWPSEEVMIKYGNAGVRWGVNAFGAIALVILAFFCRKKKAEISQNRLILEYSLFPMLMLLVSPVSETHHLTTLFVMFFPAFLYLDELPQKSIAYQSIMWGALIAFVTHIMGYIPPFDHWGFSGVGAFVFWCIMLVFLGWQNQNFCGKTIEPGQ